MRITPLRHVLLNVLLLGLLLLSGCGYRKTLTIPDKSPEEVMAVYDAIYRQHDRWVAAENRRRGGSLLDNNWRLFYNKAGNRFLGKENATPPLLGYPLGVWAEFKQTPNWKDGRKKTWYSKGWLLFLTEHREEEIQVTPREAGTVLTLRFHDSQENASGVRRHVDRRLMEILGGLNIEDLSSIRAIQV